MLVGINLLREGLDIPEVSLVAILDADKEGFLRSERSLIQTIGRAARHINGKAILYADRMTDSMKARDRRDRAPPRQADRVQRSSMGITPKGVKKRIKDMIDGVYDIDEERKELKAAQAQREVRGDAREGSRQASCKQLEKQMLDAREEPRVRARGRAARPALQAARGAVRRGAADRDVTPRRVRAGHLPAPLPFAARIATSMSRYFHENPNADGQ